MINLIKSHPHIFFTAICLLTFTAVLTTLYCENENIRNVFFYIAIIFSIIILLLIARYFYKISKLVFKNKTSTYSDDFPEYEMAIQLAKNMKIKLNKKPIILKKGLNNATFNDISNQLILGDLIINKLETLERLALIAHEFAHVKKLHKFITIIITFLVLLVSIIISQENYDYIFFICFISLFLSIFPIMSRSFEYAADIEAARKVGVDNVIALLTKIDPPEKLDTEYVTHPSTKKRIKRLIKYKSKHP